MTRSDDARMLAYAANRAKAHPHYLGWVLARYSSWRTSQSLTSRKSWGLRVTTWRA